MLRRILDCKVAVITTLAMLGDDAMPTVTNEEWQIAEQSLEVLEIFDIVTNVCSAEKQVTASTIILFYKQILKHLTGLSVRADLLPEVRKLADTFQVSIILSYL